LLQSIALLKINQPRVLRPLIMSWLLLKSQPESEIQTFKTLILEIHGTMLVIYLMADRYPVINWLMNHAIG